MKKILFSLCILLICLLFCRFVMGNNAAISTEAMISYIADNFSTNETISEMMTSLTKFMEVTEGLILNETIRNWLENIDITATFEDVLNGNPLQIIVAFIEIMVNVVYYLIYFIFFVFHLIFYGIPIILSLIRDSYHIFKLVNYVLFGTAL